MCLYLQYLCTFCNIIMTGESTHTTSKERMAPEIKRLRGRAHQPSITDTQVKWSLRFAFTYFQPVTQCCK